MITQALDPWTLPAELQRHLVSIEGLGTIYKQLDAPFGQFGHDSELVSTRAVQSGSPGEAVYRGFDEQLEACATQREVVAGEINRLLTGVEFEGGHVVDGQVWSLAAKGAWLIAQMHVLSVLPTPPSHLLCG